MSATVLSGALVGCAPQESSTPTPAPADGEALPPAPLLEAQVKCIEEAGFEAKVDFMGQISGPEMDSTQSDLWIATATECGEKTGYLSPQLSPEQIAELYQQEVTTYECLTAEGYPSETPPSEQTFQDTWGTGEQYYASYEVWMSASSPADMKKISEKCMPPTWFLNVTGLGN